MNRGDMEQEADKKQTSPPAEAAPAVKAAASPAGPPARKKAPAKARPDLERELSSRLSFLRQAAREAGHNYVINLEHDLIVLAEAVREAFRSKSGPGKKDLARFERVLEIVDRTKLKPAKGRRKDLKRIEEAVAFMDKLLVKKK